MSKTDYRGIDYGMGMSNIDRDADIRYGVIPHHAVGSAWYESAEGFYGSPACPNCGGDAVEYDESKHESYDDYRRTIDRDYACQRCEHYMGSEYAYGDEPQSHFVDDEEITAEQGYDSPDIFITKSIYYTRAQFCSPCAPGACYLKNPCDDGAKAYCFGPDWFEEGKCPYPVYRVDNDECIYTPKS
jgi:hypothetical protein